MARLAPALALLAACACSHAEVRRVGTHLPEDPAWPRGEGRQIAWVGEIRGPEGLGIERGFFRRVWDFIVGRDEREGLYRPYAVAVDADGRLAIADPGRRAVHLYDPARRQVRRVDGAPGSPFRTPIAVAFVGRTLLVADADAGRVSAFGDDGRPAPLPAALPPLRRPVGLAVDATRGRLLVVDSAAHLVHVLPLGRPGEAVALGGRGTEAGRFNFPTHVAVDGAGRVAVCDAMNFRIQLFDADLRPAGTFGRLGDGLGDLPRPKGIAVDREGVLFVLEGLYDVVQAFDGEGKLLGVFGGSGVGPGRFWLAGGMALDRRGLLYVADTYNARVQVFDLEARTP
jgi:sugar lactone lactonase YvrE